MVLDDTPLQSASSPTQNDSVKPQSPSPWRLPPLKLNPELVVRPDIFTMYVGFLGHQNWKTHVARDMSARVQGTWVMANRALTQEEFDALTVHSSRGTYYDGLGFSTGAALTTGILYRSARKSEYFPTKASPIDFVRSIHHFAVADRAGFGRAIASGAFRALFWMSGSAILYRALGAGSTMMGIMGDPRLKDLFSKLPEDTPEEIRKRKMQATGERFQRRLRNGEGALLVQFPDDSEYGGAYGDNVQGQNSYGAPSVSDSPTYGTSYSTNQSDQYNDSIAQQRSVDAVSREPRMYSNPEQQMSASQTSSAVDLLSESSYDDASPTAAEYRNTDDTGAVPASNSWARIRQQNAPTSQSRAQWGRNQPLNPPDSSYESVSGDQDRYSNEKTRDKEQAQADFNRMMDAERNASMEESPKNKGWWS